MEGDNRIRELEQQIRLLAEEQVTAKHRLEELYQQLNVLKAELGGSPSVVRREALYTPADKPGQQGIEQFIGLRLIHLAGIIVLLTGISIGIKYAIDQELISPIARIGLAYGAGLVLAVFAWRLRTGYNLFSAILFSGSMACCYFTTYGALAYYGFISVPLAFAVMVALTIFTVIQSIYYNRIEIAVIGLVGAYGIPFLVSNNTGRLDLFFSYITLINAGVVFLAFRKNWRAVSVLALVITWSLFLGWLLLQDPDKRVLMATGFGCAFYLMFLIDAFARKVLRKGLLSGSDQIQVLALNVMLYVALVAIFSRLEQNPVFETGIMCVYVAALAFAIRTFFPDELKFQRSVFTQALVLLVLFIAARWDGVLVTILWVILAIILFIAGVFGKQAWMRVCSVMLIGGTLLKLITIDSIRFTAGQRILSFIVFGVLLLVGSFYYQRFNRNKDVEKA